MRLAVVAVVFVVVVFVVVLVVVVIVVVVLVVVVIVVVLVVVIVVAGVAAAAGPRKAGEGDGHADRAAVLGDQGLVVAFQNQLVGSVRLGRQRLLAHHAASVGIGHDNILYPAARFGRYGKGDGLAIVRDGGRNRAAADGRDLDDILAAVGIADVAVLFLGGQFGFLGSRFLGGLRGRSGTVGHGDADGGSVGLHVQRAAGHDRALANVDDAVAVVQHHADRQRAGDLRGAVARVRVRRRRRVFRILRDLRPFAAEGDGSLGAFGHGEEVPALLVGGHLFVGDGSVGSVLHEQALVADAMIGRRVHDDLHGLAGLHVRETFADHQRALRLVVGRFAHGDSHGFVGSVVFFRSVVGLGVLFVRSAGSLVKQAGQIVVHVVLFVRLVAAEQVGQILAHVVVIARRSRHRGVFHADDDVVIAHFEEVIVARVGVDLRVTQAQRLFGIGALAGLQIAQLDGGYLVARLRNDGDLYIGTLVGLGAGNRHLALLGIVGLGRLDVVAGRLQTGGQLLLQGLALFTGYGLADGFAQQQAGDVLDIVHRAGLLPVAFPVALFVGGRRRGSGGRPRIRGGVGMHRHVAGGHDMGVLVLDAGGHVLHQHVNGEIAAGAALVPGALFGLGGHLHGAFGIELDIALVRGKLRAVHHGVHVGHHRADGQRDGQVGRLGGGVRHHGALRLRGDAARGFQHRGLVEIDFGIQHRDADRQRRQVGVAAAGVDAGLDLGIHANGTGAVLGEHGVVCSVIGRAGIDAAVHVDLGAADLHVDQVQDIGQGGDIQYAALLAHLRADVHVARGVDGSVRADVHLGRMGHVEEIGGDGLGRGDDIVQADAGLSLLVVLNHLSGERAQLNVVGDHGAVDVDLLRLDDDVHVLGGQVGQGHGVAVVLDFAGVDDQLVQETVGPRYQHDLRVARGGRGDDLIIGKHGVGRIGRRLLAVGLDHSQIVIFTGLGQVDFHGGFVFQFVGDLQLAARHGRDGHLQFIIGLVEEVDGTGGIGCIDHNGAALFALFERAAQVQAIIVRIHDGDLFHGIAHGDIHVHPVGALAGIDLRRSAAAGSLGRGGFAGFGHRDGIVAVAGIHLDIAHAVAGLDGHGVILGSADDRQIAAGDADALFQRQIDAGQQHVDAVDVDIAVDLRGGIRVGIVSAVIILSRTGGHYF